jgi:ferredoxin
MTHIIASACIDVKDGACQKVCPVDSIYEGGRMMYIHPEECIDCGICLSVCPVQAIFADDELPAVEEGFRAANAEFFGPAVTGWGAPGGADAKHVSTQDHPEVVVRRRGTAVVGRDL